jgi:hypothetical protein
VSAYLLTGVRPLGDGPVDMLISDGESRALGGDARSAAPTGAHVVDANGLIALPGLVDLHTHLREPGREDAETVESGTRAAAVGGWGAGAATGADLAGRTVVIVGDILHSRGARSTVLLLHTLGADVTLVAPPTLLPVGVDTWPCATSYNLDSALDGTDVVMMLRVQRERMNAAYFPSAREYSRRCGLDSRRLGLLPDHAIVMHPGPMNRGLEISAEAADCARSTVVEQVGNGVSVRMAVLYLLLAGGPPEAASPESADRELVGVAK